MELGHFLSGIIVCGIVVIHAEKGICPHPFCNSGISQTRQPGKCWCSYFLWTLVEELGLFTAMKLVGWLGFPIVGWV